MTASGDNGMLRVGYQCAAVLGKWNLTRNQEVLAVVQCEIGARVLVVDSYWSTQIPMRLGLWMGEAWWVWDVPEPPVLKLGSTATFVVEGNPVAIPNFTR